MRPRRPEILELLGPVREHLEKEKHKLDRISYGSPKYSERKRRTAADMVIRIERIERWVRERITSDEWKGLLG